MHFMNLILKIKFLGKHIYNNTDYDILGAVVVEET